MNPMDYIKKRPLEKYDIIAYDIMIALAATSRCIDKQVACIIIDQRFNILSVGVNNVIECDLNCDDKENRLCNVRHAEDMAFSHLRQTGVKPWRAYINLFPCMPCQRLLFYPGQVQEIVAFGRVHKEPTVPVTVFTHEEVLEAIGKDANYLRRINLLE